MIDEVLFMETRIFSEYCKKMNMPPKEVNRLFNLFRIWEYIESCYDTLHLNGDECVIDDVQMIIKKKGAVV